MTIDPSDIEKTQVEKFIGLQVEDTSSSKPISSSSSIAENSPRKENQLEDYITNPILAGFKSEILSSRKGSNSYSLPYGKSFYAEIEELTFSGIPGFVEKWRRKYKRVRKASRNWHFLVYPGQSFARIIRNTMLEILESQDAIRFRHWLALTMIHLEDHPLFNRSTVRDAFLEAIKNFEDINFLKLHQIPELKTLRAAKVYMWPYANSRDFEEVQDRYYRFIPSDPKKNRKIPEIKKTGEDRIQTKVTNKLETSEADKRVDKIREHQKNIFETCQYEETDPWSNIISCSEKFYVIDQKTEKAYCFKHQTKLINTPREDKKSFYKKQDFIPK